MGSWGTALAAVLVRNGHSVRIWDRNEAVVHGITEQARNPKYLSDIVLPTGLLSFKTLEESLDAVRLIVIAVPSHAFSDLLKSIQPFLTQGQALVCAAKGLATTGAFLHQIAQEELGSERLYAVLSGPSFAREVAMGLPTAVAVASCHLPYAREVADYFRNNCFATYATQDVWGVQLGAVVKNVLAVAVGMSDGLQFGANARAALITQGLSEMVRLGESLGAQRETLMGLSGCGDVILTCTDDQSRNRRFGLALASGLSTAEAVQKIGQSVEAVYNVEQLCQLARAQGVKLPISEQVFSVIKQRVSVREALTSVFANASKDE